MRTPTKKRPPLEMEPGEGKAHEMKETPEEEVREGTESEEGEEYPKKSRKRSAKGAKSTKAPMDAECGCGAKGRKGKCDGSCGKAMKDGGNYPMKGRSDALTAPEYLAACDLGIQGRSRSYIRARLDAAERLDLKCGKGAISKGEKCRKGPATKAQGPNVGVQIGQAAKGVGLGVLEAGKWVSGYNIGKTIATRVTGGKNEKASGGAKAAAVLGSTLLLAGAGGLGAARRVGAFGSTDLQQHEKNQKKEKKWRRSVGYKDSVYAPGFSVDYDQLAL